MQNQKKVDPRPSIWQLEAPTNEYPSLQGCVEADIAIVGGGVVGLSTALHLKEQRYPGEVLLLEAKSLGFGGTGRCGGILVADDLYIPGSEANYQLMRKSLSRHGLMYLLTSGTEQLIGLEEEYDCENINPQQLVNELGNCASKLGARIYEHTQVESWDEGSDFVSLRGDGWQVKCGVALMATGAYSPSKLLESLGLNIYGEDCIAVRVANSPIPWTFYRENALDFTWGRKIGDDRFLFGGGLEYSSPLEVSPEERLKRLLEGLSADLCQLKSISVVACWTGMLSRFADGLGWRIGKIPGDRRLWFAGGFDGYGLITGYSAGLKVARKLVSLV